MYVFWQWLSSSAPLPIYKYKLENYFMWSNGINEGAPHSKHSPYYVSFQPFNGLEMWIFRPYIFFLSFFILLLSFSIVGRTLMAGTLAILGKAKSPRLWRERERKKKIGTKDDNEIRLLVLYIIIFFFCFLNLRGIERW